MSIILFLICAVASTLGAIAGFGGGIIIKPLLDMFHLFPVSTASFLSGCTVLSMSIVSLLRTRKNGIALDMRIATLLAVGSAGGGFIGKYLFDVLCDIYSSQNTIGAIQAICLVTLTALVYLYICKKDRLHSHHLKNAGVVVLVGVALGIISAFLGIGGGPFNIATLFFFFSMEAKIAAKYSIYMILFSQSASVLPPLIGQTAPAFFPTHLAFMAAGGIAGALIGAAISARMKNEQVEKILRTLTLTVIAIGVYNIVRFMLMAT